MNSCPSGNRSTRVRALCRASQVLPIPPVPANAEIITIPDADCSGTAVNCASSSTRPTNADGAAGNCRGTGRAGPELVGVVSVPR